MPKRETSGVNIEQSIISRAVKGTKETIGGVLQSWFGPQNPITVSAPPDAKGRTWEFTPGYNLLTQKRPNEPLNFNDLRMLARSLDVVALAIATRKDQLESIEWEFRLKDDEGNKKKDAEDQRIKELKDFFAMPDPQAGLTFKRWQRKLMDDLLILDQPCINILKNKGGKPFALRIIDGATIKLLVDANGLPPAPPDPCYQQWMYGVPSGDFTSDEMLVMPRELRPDKIMGYSPVEQIYITINIAIRKQLLELNGATEGNIPEAMVPTPESWGPEQIAQFQLYFDSLMSGNYGERSKLRFVPNGMDKAIFTRKDDKADEKQMYLAKVICYAFSLPATWIDKAMNRATAVQAAESAENEGLMPLLNYWQDFFNTLIIKYWGYTDIECVPKFKRDVDPLKQAEADKIRTDAGHLSIDEVRSTLGFEAIGQPNAVMTMSGLISIGDIGKKEAEERQAIADEIAAKTPKPEGQPPKGEPPQGGSPKGGEEKPKPKEVEEAPAEKLAKKKARTVKMLPRVGHEKAEKYLATTLTRFFSKQGKRLAQEMASSVKKADEDIELIWKELVSVFEPQIATVAKRAALQALAQVGATDEDIVNSVSENALAYAKSRAAELVGMKYDGEKLVANPNAEWAITDSTREMMRNTLSDAVERGLSTDAIAEEIESSYAFSAERASMIARTELASAHTQGNLEGWRGSGVVTGKESLLSSGHEGEDECDQAADDGIVAIDALFSTGDDGPPYHPNCECALVAVLSGEDAESMEGEDE